MQGSGAIWLPGQGGHLPWPLLTDWWRQEENKSELREGRLGPHTPTLLGLRKKQGQNVR